MPIQVNAITNTTYQNNQNIRSVNLNYKPWINNNMYNAFQNCSNLQNVTNINNNIINMYHTFYNCISLVNAPIIPNSVTNMAYTFAFCSNLVNASVIPNSVTDMKWTFTFCEKLVNVPEISNSVTTMASTFQHCSNLVNAPVIPNSVIDMSSTFAFCNKLVNAPIIPNSVTNMGLTFISCSNLTNIPEIPNSVTNMNSTFGGCRSLVNAPIIPNSVTNMNSTFEFCYNLVGNINILSNQITDATNCFANTTLTKNVYIPYTYENSVNTATYNAFINAGYDENGTSCGVYLKDINASIMYTLTINPTPTDAIVTLTADGYTQEGNSITVKKGTEVTYIISKTGYITSPTYTKVVTQDETIEAPALTPNTPMLITNTETKTLPAGTYKYICIGGGASGQNAVNSSNPKIGSNFAQAGGMGGMGGGSGYITYGEFTLDENTEINFTVGKGGIQTSALSGGAPIAGEASTITKVSDGSILGTASGGIINSSIAGVKSSSGGSGGAAQSGRYASYQLNGYSSRGPSDGHNGGLGGGNGEAHTNEDAAVWTHQSGTGFYNTTKSYGNNAGIKGSPGTSGGGGIGVSAIQDIITNEFVSTMDDTKLQTLYNSIGGGGSGGGATVYDMNTIAGSGGAGGGGGGWFAGEAGAIKSTITTRQATGGNGGDGAIILKQI